MLKQTALKVVDQFCIVSCPTPGLFASPSSILFEHIIIIIIKLKQAARHTDVGLCLIALAENRDEALRAISCDLVALLCLSFQ